MTVERNQLGCQTTYTLHEGEALACTLTLGANEDAPPEWKVRLPGPGGSRQLDVMRVFAAPVAVRLRAWLAPIIGPNRATELVCAVGARPPGLPVVPMQTPGPPRLRIPRQRDYRG
jgi:hypothetical protein